MRDRSREISMLRDTLQILEQGWYEKNGKKVKLKLSRKEMERTEVYLPGDVSKNANRRDFDPSFAADGCCVHGCENIDSFALARKRLKDAALFPKDSPTILVLNLANPVHPGGGVRRGARAQEEDLCRKSSLLLSLESQAAEKYYEFNKSLHTYMGSDALMITPHVEIIKDENGELLDDTAVVSVLTCAAPMVSRGKEGMSECEYEDMVYNRIMGEEYLIYQPESGLFKLKLHGAKGPFDVEWFYPQTGERIMGRSFSGSMAIDFTPPKPGEVVLYLKKQVK